MGSGLHCDEFGVEFDEVIDSSEVFHLRILIRFSPFSHDNELHVYTVAQQVFARLSRTCFSGCISCCAIPKDQPRSIRNSWLKKPFTFPPAAP